jgi:hypothetical protein
MYTVAKLAKADNPCSSGAGGAGSILANSNAQNVLSFRRWRFEMKLGPFFFYSDHGKSKWAIAN